MAEVDRERCEDREDAVEEHSIEREPILFRKVRPSHDLDAFGREKGDQHGERLAVLLHQLTHDFADQRELRGRAKPVG